MESNSFLKSLNWSILKATSDDESDSDDTLIDNNELTHLITKTIFHNGSKIELPEQLSQVKYDEKCNDYNVNEIKGKIERESCFEFSEVEPTKHVKNKNERESYFGFSDMDEESNQRGSVKHSRSELDLSKEGFVGMTDVVSSTDTSNHQNSSNKCNVLDDIGVANEQIFKIQNCNLTANKLNESNNLQAVDGSTNSENEKENSFRSEVVILNELISDVDLIGNTNEININEIANHIKNRIFTEEVPLKKLESIECGKNTTLATDSSFQSDDTLEGLTENLENICENPLDMLFENSNYIPVRKPCSPPLTLCTGTRRRILPAEKKLPKYNKKQNLTQAVKQLPLRKCASYYIYKSNRKPIPEEKESSPGKKEKNTYSSDEKIEILMANTLLETTQSKRMARTNILKTNKKCEKIKLKPKKEPKKKIKYTFFNNKTLNEELMSLLEIEERLKSLEGKVTYWVNGSEVSPPSREQAFQMLTDTNRLVSQLQQKLEKKNRKHLSTKVKEKKIISLLLDRSQLLAVTIDNAIVEADRLMEIEHLNAVTGDDGNDSSQSTPTQDSQTSVKNCSSKKYSCLDFLKPILKNSNSENVTDDTNFNNKHISFSDEIEYHLLPCDQGIGNSGETLDDAKTASGNVEIPHLANQNIAEITFNNNDITQMANSFKNKTSLNDDQMVTFSKVTEVNITSKRDLLYLENQSQVSKETSSRNNGYVQNKTLQTSLKNLKTASKEVQAVHTPCSDSINVIGSIINTKNPGTTMKSLENQDQKSEKEILHSNTEPPAITKDNISEKVHSDLTEVSMCSSESKKVNLVNTCEQKFSSHNDNKQKVCEINIGKRQLQISESSLNNRTKQMNQGSLILTDLINSRDVNRDNTACVFVSDQSAKSKSSFGFSEPESEDESWVNISIMNVKTIRVKDQEEWIPMSNLSSDMFESADWFEDLDEWEKN